MCVVCPHTFQPALQPPALGHRLFPSLHHTPLTHTPHPTPGLPHPCPSCPPPPLPTRSCLGPGLVVLLLRIQQPSLFPFLHVLPIIAVWLWDPVLDPTPTPLPHATHTYTPIYLPPYGHVPLPLPRVWTLLALPAHTTQPLHYPIYYLLHLTHTLFPALPCMDSHTLRTFRHSRCPSTVKLFCNSASYYGPHPRHACSASASCTIPSCLTILTFLPFLPLPPPPPPPGFGHSNPLYLQPVHCSWPCHCVALVYCDACSATLRLLPGQHHGTTIQCLYHGMLPIQACHTSASPPIVSTTFPYLTYVTWQTSYICLLAVAYALYTSIPAYVPFCLHTLPYTYLGPSLDEQHSAFGITLFYLQHYFQWRVIYIYPAFSIAASSSSCLPPACDMLHLQAQLLLITIMSCLDCVYLA